MSAAEDAVQAFVFFRDGCGDVEEVFHGPTAQTMARRFLMAVETAHKPNIRDSGLARWHDEEGHWVQIIECCHCDEWAFDGDEAGYLYYVDDNWMCEAHRDEYLEGSDPRDCWAEMESGSSRSCHCPGCRYTGEED